MVIRDGNGYVPAGYCLSIPTPVTKKIYPTQYPYPVAGRNVYPYPYPSGYCYPTGNPYPAATRFRLIKLGKKQ